MNEFKDMFHYLRKRSGYTQVELAEKLGLSKGMISMCERGERRPSYETLEAIADFFNVDMNFLLGYDPRSNKLSERATTFAIMYEELNDAAKDVVDAMIRLQLQKEYKNEEED